MIIEILNCKPDGTQELIQKEVADDYFAPTAQEDTEKNEQAQSAETAAES